MADIEVTPSQGEVWHWDPTLVRLRCEQCGHRWEATVGSRTAKCPQCSQNAQIERTYQGPRYVVVIQENSFTAILGDRTVAVVPVTRSPQAEKLGAVPLPASQCGIGSDSFAVFWQPTTVSRSMLDRRVGSVSPQVLALIIANLRRFFGL